MRDIAEAAGVSKPLLYHYFPSKIDLFKAAVADKAAELQRLIETDRRRHAGRAARRTASTPTWRGSRRTPTRGRS